MLREHNIVWMKEAADALGISFPTDILLARNGKMVGQTFATRMATQSAFDKEEMP